MSAENSPVDAAAPPKRGSGVFKKILIVLVLIIVAFVGFVAAKPDEFRIVRSATFASPIEDVFAQVNDFHNWEAWSPWAKLDPKAKNSFDGPAAGTGAIFAWDGNDKVGAGRMTILESRPHELVKIKLEFIRPFEDVCSTVFTFKPEGDKTVATWNMSGKQGFLQKAICMFMNMDKMVGGQFDEGLANMKAVLESAEKVPAKP